MKNINNNIKAFFIDLDGTALDAKKDGGPWISDANMIGITNARQDGKHVIISTGRVDGIIFDIFNKIGGDYLIGANGARVWNKKLKLMVDIQMPVSTVARITDFAQKYKLPMKVSDDYLAYGVQNFIQRYIANKIGFKTASNYSFDMQIPRSKIILWGPLSRKKVLLLSKELQKLIPEIEVATSGHGRTIEITGQGATKGRGNEFVWRELGLRKDETMHIGDTMNDSTTVGHVGRLVAMKNSSKKLKELARFIGPHYKNGGLAKVLNGEYTRKRSQ